jgi:hypothetical protein
VATTIAVGGGTIATGDVDDLVALVGDVAGIVVESV